MSPKNEEIPDLRTLVADIGNRIETACELLARFQGADGSINGLDVRIVAQAMENARRSCTQLVRRGEESRGAHQAV